VIRIAAIALVSLLAACSTVEKREPLPTSGYQEKSAGSGIGADAAAAPASPDALDRIELSGGSIPAGTTLKFVLLDAISSATAKVGDIFRLKSHTAVLVDGVEILPAGLSAHGEVIHADNRGMVGKPGELLLKVRAIEWQGRSIKLRNSVGSVGKDKSRQIVTIQILFGLAVLFVGGNEIEIPPNTIILGDLAEAIAVPAGTQAPNSLPSTEAR
jgi:hypothetical protein